MGQDINIICKRCKKKAYIGRNGTVRAFQINDLRFFLDKHFNCGIVDDAIGLIDDYVDNGERDNYLDVECPKDYVFYENK